MKPTKYQPLLFSLCGVLLVGLIYQFSKLPGGMILPGYYFGLVLLVTVIISCFILAAVLKIFIKSVPYRIVFLHTSLVGLIWLHYFVYSPQLHIQVPTNYRGEVMLILRDSSHNNLHIDNNGIGYITRWTFNKTYLKPVVTDKEGVDISNRCIPFNNSSFWAIGRGPDPSGRGSMRYLSFKIDPLNVDKD
ncbi:hypothetical protein [Flavihumibacter solisilvae]|uniref:ResB-like domain-containing protein n=1 Tax=Flavihumibacter solisilvae TaxID=1349421 RepID=A0A0C1LKP8_9BACT|nr:hypothetical protein [Flavihumibacter solisilvae]KIC95943.1 hypothetical protein OI18_03420 [Flavihumibacter solisilvae]